jgi:diguanylate cyclase (GGDEF)-like protein
MYISIRWKALILVSLILFLITLTWISYSIYFELKNYRDSVHQEQLRFQNSLDQILDDSFANLSKNAQIISNYPHIKSANQGPDKAGLRSKLDSQWYDLNLNIGVDYIAIEDETGSRIYDSLRLFEPDLRKKFQTALKGFGKNTTKGQVSSFVFCDKDCIQIIKEPFFFSDNKKGYIVLGQNMSELISRFHSISGSGIAVLIHRPEENTVDTESQYIQAWKSYLWAATNFDEVLSVLQEYSIDHKEVQNVYYQSSLSGILDSQYRVSRLIPANYLQVGYTASYVTINDNSKNITLFKNSVFNQIITGLIAWVVAVLLVLLAVMGPIQRVLVVANALTFLPQHKFTRVRKILGPKRYSSVDEISELENGALKLTDDLEALNSQVIFSETRLKEQILAATRSKDFLKRLFDNADLFIVIQSKTFHCKDANYFFEGQFETDSFLDILVDDEDIVLLKQKLPDLLTNKADKFVHEAWAKNRHGDLLVIAWTHTLVETVQGEFGILSIGMDITQRKRDEHALKWLADNDSLTKIGNRRVFHSGLEKLLALQTVGAVVFIDVNRFKQINDIYGHTAGDQLLVEIAETLKHQVRDNDLVCRLAGDEFTLLLTDIDKHSLPGVLSHLSAKLSGTLEMSEGRRVDYSCSLGAAMFPEHGSDSQTLIVHSDMAMYQAKRRGLNNWHIFDYSDDSLKLQQEEHQLMSILKQAIKESLFTFEFQPIMSLSKKEVSHYETLLRLKDEHGQPISPKEFIPVAERVGLIGDIDLWVVDRLFKLIGSFFKEDTIRIKLSVNISGPSLQDNYFVDRLVKLAKYYQVKPDMVVIELTETAYIDNLNKVMENLEFLNFKGFEIALDDFGVGFSSFSYMKELPLNYVKLDGSYVRNLKDNHKNQAFIESVVIMAKAFNMKTIAEYVEDKKTMKLLKSLGVDYAQGFYVGKSIYDFSEPIENANSSVTVKAAKIK